MASMMRPLPEAVSFMVVWPREAAMNLALGALYCTRSCDEVLFVVQARAHVTGALIALPPQEAVDLVTLVRGGGVVGGEVAKCNILYRRR